MIAVANPLRGVKNDSDYLASVIDGLDGDVVLVGHSYGGTLITNAAAGSERVKALVYVGGFAPDRGESAAELSGRYEGGTLGETLVAFELPDGNNDLYIVQERYRAQFAADVPEAEAARMAVTQRPIVEAALNEASGDAGWKTIPSWFLFGEKDQNIPAAVHRFMAERAGARRIVEIDRRFSLRRDSRGGSRCRAHQRGGRCCRAGLGQRRVSGQSRSESVTDVGVTAVIVAG